MNGGRSLPRVLVHIPEHGVQPSRFVSLGHRPRRGSVEGRRSSVVGESGQREQYIGQHPDVILSKARARVAKLEVAMNAVGEDDPTYPALRDSLKQARVQAKVRPVEDRIKATTSFIEWSKRRIGEHQANILRLQEQLAEAKAEEEQARQHLHDGEERWCKLHQEASRMAEDIPPTVPVDFAAELAQLRNSVHELKREGRVACTTPFRCTLRRARTEATSKSVIQHFGVGPVESRGSRAERASRSGSPRGVWRFFCFDGDLDRQRRVEFPQCEQVQSVVDNMTISARYGLRGVRVGEAKHPGPPRVNTSTDQPETGVVEALEFDLTQADSTDDEMPGTIADGSDESSTGSMVQRPRRRLSLIWHEEAADVVWHRDAGAAEGVVRNLASRIGAVPEGEVPAPVRRQRWSPLNVPLIWSSAGHDDSTPVLDRLAGSLTWCTPVGIPRRDHRRTRRSSQWVVGVEDSVQDVVHPRTRRSHGMVEETWFPWHSTRKSHLSQGTGAHLDRGLQDRSKGCVVGGQLRGGCVARRPAGGSSQGNPRSCRTTASPDRSPGCTDESF